MRKADVYLMETLQQTHIRSFLDFVYNEAMQLFIQRLCLFCGAFLDSLYCNLLAKLSAIIIYRRQET